MKNLCNFKFGDFNFPFTKIVTHAGTFHADEILALATIKFFTNVFSLLSEVERTFDVTEALKDNNICVLDIGREYDIDGGNFDHHQDAELSATNIMMLRYLLPDTKLRQYMEEYLYTYVSECDKGGEKLQGVPTLTAIVRSLNNVSDGFQRAFDICLSAVYGVYCTAVARIESEERWAKIEKVGKFAITDSSEHIVGWHEMAEKDGIVLLVTPNARGGYQITSRSTDVFVIPEDSRQTFRHNSGFLAVYPTKESAIEHAMELIKS
jgi:uncharacterized UPF0160 family protein